MTVAGLQTKTFSSAASYLNSAAVTPSTAVTAGSLLVLSINLSANGGTAVSTVTDNAGNAWTRWFASTLANNSTELWTATASTSTSLTITATTPVYSSWAVIFREYSGVAASNARDVYATATDTSYVQAHAATAASAVAGDLVIGGFTSSQSSDSFTAGNGFSNLASVTGAQYLSAALQDQVLAASGNASAPLATSQYDEGIAWVACFKPAVTAAPATPSNVIAGGGSTSVALSWSACQGATTYKVLRSSSVSGTFTQVGTSTTASYTDTGLTNGTTYYYQVVASNSYGDSTASTTVSGTPVATQATSWYPYGVQPTGKTLDSIVTVFKAKYAAAKAFLLTQSGMPSGMPAGAWRVAVADAGSAGAGGVNCTFSEGMGYWLLITAFTSRVGSPIYDPQARAIHDGLWTYVAHYLDANGLMNWRQDANGNITGTGSATDGDLDIALGLLMKSRTDPTSTMGYNYAALATAYINALDKWVYYPANHSNAALRNVQTNGDSWDAGLTGNVDIMDPDYVRPAHYQEFGTFTGNTTRWNAILTANQALVQSNYVTKYPTGYVADRGTREGAQISGQSYEYGYNAIRYPWVNTLHLLWNGDATAQAGMSKLANAERARASQIPANARAEGNLQGTSFGTYINKAYASGFAVAGLSGSDTAQWAADGIDFLSTLTEQNYFGMSLECLALLEMTGEMKPYRTNSPASGGTGGSTTPTTAPTANSAYYWTGSQWKGITNLTVSTPSSSTSTAPAFLFDSTGMTLPDAAFSVRRLTSAYTGPCMRVQRASDNTQIDIGFTSSGDLDTVALTSWAGSSDTYVTTWYNQNPSGIGSLTQTNLTNMFRIYSGTAVDMKNGKPTLYALDANRGMSTAALPAYTGTAVTGFVVGAMANSTTTYSPCFLSIEGASNTDTSDTEGGILVRRSGSSTPSASWEMYRSGSTRETAAGIYNQLQQITAIINDNVNPTFTLSVDGTASSNGAAVSIGAFQSVKLGVGWAGTIPQSVAGQCVSEALFYQSLASATVQTNVASSEASYFATAASSSSGSGSGSYPTTLPGWTLTMNEDFNTPCAEGSFLSTYSDFTAYPTGTPDTWAQANGGGSSYRTDNISVANSICTIRVYADSNGSYGAALVPIPAGTTAYHDAEYLRDELKIRCLDPVSWQKIASLLWPDSDSWNDGEMDWVEMNLNSTAQGFNHYPGNPTSQDSCSTNVILSDGWHVFAREWTAGQLKYIVDGTTVKTFTSHVASTSFHPIIQIERVLSSTPAPVSGQTCHVQLDYYRQWSPS